MRLCAEERLDMHRGRHWRVSEAGYLAFGRPEPFVPVVSPGDEAQKKVTAAIARVVDVVDRIESGAFPVTPAEPHMCMFCGYAAVCRGLRRRCLAAMKDRAQQSLFDAGPDIGVDVATPDEQQPRNVPAPPEAALEGQRRSPRCRLLTPRLAIPHCRMRRCRMPRRGRMRRIRGGMWCSRRRPGQGRRRCWWRGI